MLTQSRLFSTAVLVVAAAAVSEAQGARTALQDAKNVACEFRFMSTGNWGRDNAPIGEAKAATLTLGFTNVNTDDGSAEVAGTTAASGNTAELPIITRWAGGYLHFMQVGSSGFLYTTTVFDQPGRTGRLKAVHSRHEWNLVALPGYTSRPEQYWGDCEVK